MALVSDIAKSINDYNDKGKFFWSCGLVKETAKLWKNPCNYNLLDETAQCMANHYINKRKEV